MIPTPLIDYLRSSPLPTIIYEIDLSSPLTILESKPLLLNQAVKKLINNSTSFVACLSPSYKAKLLKWINKSRESEDDIELELELVPSNKTIRWRRTLCTEVGRNFLILTALTLPELDEESGTFISSFFFPYPLSLPSKSKKEFQANC